MTNVFVILGPPGSGKGTQSELLAKKLGYNRIVIGDLRREFIKGTSAEAREDKERYDKGIPGPDKLIGRLFKEEMHKLKDAKGIVLDTFPLSMGQARILDEVLAEFEIKNFKVFFLNVEKNKVIKRIEGRKICSQCKRIYLAKDKGYAENVCPVCGGKLIVRKDDDPVVAAQRYDEYERRNADIKEFYRGKGVLIEINGDKSIEAVHQEIINKLDLSS